MANCGILAEGFGVLGRPVLVSEQYPKGLGQTVAELAERLPEGTPAVEKLRFSACGVEAFDAAARGRRLHRPGWSPASRRTSASTRRCSTCSPADYAVHVAADAVSSRAPANRALALEKMAADGAQITSAEMALFEMLEVAGTDEFKAISRLVQVTPALGRARGRPRARGPRRRRPRAPRSGRWSSPPA